MDEQTSTERVYTELFHRLPLRPLPAGFRDAVMARLAPGRAPRAWEWILATLLALPNGAFLLWIALVHGSDLKETLANVVDALAAPERWQDAQAGFYLDGLIVLAVALLGVAGMLLTHALLPVEGARARARAA